MDDTSIIDEERETLDIARTMKLSLTFCFLWFLANYTNNASLAYTSVTSSTILSSMSGRSQKSFEVATVIIMLAF